MSEIQPYSVRPSPIAGRWYPETVTALGAMVNGFMQQQRHEIIQLNTPILGVLAPHAGLRYSGPIAGQAFRYTRDLEVDTVVIVSPSHHRYPSPLLSTAHSHFETPLGQVPIATDIVDILENQLNLLRVANDPEHAIEIELPFLQQTLQDFQLVPLAMIDQSWKAAETLGKLLAHLLKARKTLLVASSDLSHFYTQQEANLLDQVILDAIEAYQPQKIIEADEVGLGYACGRGAIAAVMVAAKELGADTAHVVDYATSGDVSGDFSKVVGYGAALFH